jgi:hypothetical protein
MGWTTGVRFRARAMQGYFFCATMPTQPPIQWVPGAISPGVGSRGVKLTTHLHLVPRLRMRRAMPPTPPTFFTAWCLDKQRDIFHFTPPSKPLVPIINTVLQYKGPLYRLNLLYFDLFENCKQEDALRRKLLKHFLRRKLNVSLRQGNGKITISF